MKKRIFKFGAALTAALMICSATAGLAFADEIEAETPETTEPAAVETVDEAAPSEEATEEETPAEEEAPAEEAEDVVIPIETNDITAEDVAAEAAAEVEAAAKADDVATGSAITIGDITSSSDESYYTVSVPFSVSTVPSQMTLFVYNITAITEGAQNNTVGFKSETTTPVGYINQYDGAAAATYTFKLAKSGDNAYKEGDIIVVKIGGTDVEIPDAKSYTLTDGGSGEEWKLGDANHDGNIDNRDAILVMRYASGMINTSDLNMTEANVTKTDGDVDNRDAIMIMRYASGMIQSF